MVNTVFAFFNTFNPMTFALLLSVGAIVLMRKPADASLRRSPVPRTNMLKTMLRRGK